MIASEYNQSPCQIVSKYVLRLSYKMVTVKQTLLVWIVDLMMFGIFNTKEMSESNWESLR